jgi:hypothetical protein
MTRSRPLEVRKASCRVQARNNGISLPELAVGTGAFEVHERL